VQGELVLHVPRATDQRRLERALAELALRHEILRTRYQRLAGMALPVQVIQPSARIAWNETSRVVDGPDLTVEVAAADADTLRVRLRLSAVHGDTSSLLRIAGEWAVVYTGQQPEGTPLQYAGGSRAEARAFWQRSLAARVPPTGLPLRGAALLDRVDPLGVDISIPGALQDLWTSAAARMNLPPAALALAAWTTLLFQHGGADAVTIGVDWQERPTELASALGLLSEPLPVTVEGLGELDVSALCRSLAERLADLRDAREIFPSAEDDQPYPFGFRFVPALEDRCQAALRDAGWQIAAANSPSAPHQLLLECRASVSGPALTLYVDQTLYDESAARLLGDQLVTLLEHLCRRPRQRLGELSALSVTERHQVVTVLGEAPRLPSDREDVYARIAAMPSLAACFAGAAAAHASAAAVTGAGGTLSYATLDRRSAELAGALSRRVRGPGARVAHFLPRDVDAIVAMVAILRAGAVYVPIDPDYPEARIAFMLSDCGADLILTRRDLVPRLPEPFRHGARLLFTDETTGEVAPDVASRPADTAYMIYTSGSTGQPRGVPITHAAALYSLAARVAYYPDPIRKFLLLSSFAFDSSLAGLFGTLAQGGCLRVATSAEQKDPDRLAEIVREEGVTHLLALPSLHHLLLPRLSGFEHALAAAIVAGEACPAGLVEAHHRALPRTRLYNEYGVTEAAVWSTVGECGPTSRSRHRGPVSIGRPVPHGRVYVLDAAGKPVARGLKGEMHLGGPGLSAGYWQRPEITAEKFVRLRVREDGEPERLYRTGDHAYWDDRGELVFLGRGDGQVKIRGYRIELGEIEAALRRVTGAEQVVVLADAGAAAESAPSGAEVFLRAFVEIAGPLDVGDVRRELARLLPEPMIPSDIQALAALPRTANGKFDRRALAALDRKRQRAPYIPPQGPIEETLASLWAELLGCERVGRDDDFFVLGGHSLLAVRLVHRLTAALGRDVQVSKVFENPRLAALAGAIAEAPGRSGAPDEPAIACARAAGPPTSIVPLQSLGSRPPLYCVDPTGLHVGAYEPLAASLGPTQPVFGLELGRALTTEGPSIEPIADRLAEEIRRHQPRGPYRVLGWSLGGVLALAIARALERRGERVAFVGIVDTQPAVHLYADEVPDPVEELAAYLDPDRRDELLARPASVLRALRERLSSLPSETRVAEAVAWAQGEGLLSADDPAAAFVARYHLLRSAALFVKSLPPGALSVPIHAWWSTESLERHGGPPLDWRIFTRAGASVETLAGDHFAAIQAAQVHDRVRAIVGSLDEAVTEVA
jgi:amino acid adenylation domain-containing protein